MQNILANSLRITGHSFVGMQCCQLSSTKSSIEIHRTALDRRIDYNSDFRCIDVVERRFSEQFN